MHLNRLKKQRGSMLVISIFVILVMSLLGLAMTRILSSASEAIVYEVYGLRALNAARTGLERSVAQAFYLVPGDSSCVATIDSETDFPESDIVPVHPGFNNLAGLQNCKFVATCTSFSNINGQDYFRFRSTGSCTIDNVVVSRTVAVDARNQ